jgi:hypothetical protein
VALKNDFTTPQVDFYNDESGRLWWIFPHTGEWDYVKF